MGWSKPDERDWHVLLAHQWPLPGILYHWHHDTFLELMKTKLYKHVSFWCNYPSGNKYIQQKAALHTSCDHTRAGRLGSPEVRWWQLAPSYIAWLNPSNDVFFFFNMKLPLEKLSSYIHIISLLSDQFSQGFTLQPTHFLCWSSSLEWLRCWYWWWTNDHHNRGAGFPTHRPGNA